MEIKRNIIVGPHPRNKRDAVTTSDELPIRIRVTFGGNRVDFSTSFYVSPNNWNKDAERACSPRNHKNKYGQTDKYINDGIDTRVGYINSIFKKFEFLNVVPTIAQLREEYNAACSIVIQETSDAKDTNNATKTFFACYDEFTTENGRAHEWTVATHTKFNALKKHLSGFKKDVCFDTFTENGLTDFVDFLRIKKDMKNSTIGKQLGFLKWFLRWSQRKGYNTNEAYKTFTPKLKTTQKKVIYLTREELNKLMDYEVKESQSYLDRVKDVFLFCCFTGLRYSDAKNLKWEDVKVDKIELTTIKTCDRITIELNKHSKSILEKYKDCHFEGGQVLPVISNQKMNEYVKKLAKLAGIDEPVKEVYYKGNQRFEKTSPKYELIGTHAGRRTFVCNALSFGISPTIVMKWTGHSDYKAMRPYIDIIDEVKAQEMSKFNSI